MIITSILAMLLASTATGNLRPEHSAPPNTAPQIHLQKTAISPETKEILSHENNALFQQAETESPTTFSREAPSFSADTTEHTEVTAEDNSAEMSAENLPHNPSTATAATAATSDAQTTATGAKVALTSRGLRVTSADDRLYLVLRGYGQIAYNHHFTDADDAYTNGFILRTLRPTLGMGIGEIVDFTLQLDITATQARAYDAVVTLRPHKRVAFRLGMQKTLLNVELVQSPTGTLFLERSMVSSLSPIRDVGITMEVLPVDGLRVELGLFNGAEDGEVFAGLKSDALEAQGRIQLAPLEFLRAPPSSQILLGVGGSAGTIRGSSDQPRLTAYRSLGRRTYVDYAPDIYADGLRLRGTGYLLVAHQGFFFLSEYIASKVPVRDGVQHQEMRQQAWQIAASYAFGGRNTFQGVIPTRSLFHGGLGALQLKARVHQVRVHDRGQHIRGAVVGSEDAPSLATGVGTGASWWMSQQLRLQADYGWTSFSNEVAPEPLPDEHLFQLSLTFAL